MGVRRAIRLGLCCLIASTLTGSSASAAVTATPALAVDATRNVHHIPDAIYGVNWASDRIQRALRLPVNRWGGNETSLYDHESNAYNSGIDWYFENQIGTDTNHRLKDWVGRNKRYGPASLVTIPMLGWVADASKPEAGAFSIAKYGAQDAHDAHRPDCGNGLDSTDRRPLTDNDPTDFARRVDPAEHATGMVESLVNEHGTAARGGVRYYELDNEPALWHQTHRSVHPLPLRRDELMLSSIATALAVKTADPSAAVMGPSDWGYCGWLYAPADGDPTNNCDAPATGPVEAMAAAYVKAFRDYADAHNGRRLLDYLDEHYYPQSPGVALTRSAGSTATQAMRLRSTRSLWDPTYKDESWIGHPDHVNAPPLQFIRKLRGWASRYPGTKTAITEYNWGGTGSINGAIAQADVLGIFGRERLDLATYWNYDNAIDTSPVEWAFRLYRNYDGKGSRFQSTGIHAASTDQGRLSVYASKGRTAMTIVVVNKTRGALKAPLHLKNYAHQRTARAYTLAPSNPRGFAQKQFSIGARGFWFTYPGQSATLIRIPRV